MKPFDKAREMLFGRSAGEMAAPQHRSSAKRLEEWEHRYTILSVSAAAAAETAAWIERWKAASSVEREAMFASGLREPGRGDRAFAARASEYADEAAKAERRIGSLRSQLAATGGPRLRRREAAAELAVTHLAMGCSGR